MSESEFEVTVSFGMIRGPFKARLTIGEDEVSVVPMSLPLIGRSSLFMPVSVRSGDVEAVDADRWYRSGLRFRTTSGALDHIVVIPDDSRDRAAIHRSLVRHGFKVVQAATRSGVPFCVARTGHHATVLRDAWSVDGRAVRGADVSSLIKTRVANGLRWSAFENQAGPVVMFVTNEERAMVVVLDEQGDAGSHAVDPDAGPGTSGGFVLDNGQHDEYADRDTVPFEAGVAAVAHIIENEELDPRITWHSDR